jgi:hypothetical protein
VPQVEAERHLAVHPAEEDQLGHTNLGRRLRLLLAANARHRGALDRLVEPARLAVGDEAVRDLRSRVGEFGDQPGGREVDIVRMGHDCEGALDLVESEHAAHVRRPLVSRHVAPRTAAAGVLVSVCRVDR